jgi:hypothetical protein
VQIDACSQFTPDTVQVYSVAGWRWLKKRRLAPPAGIYRFQKSMDLSLFVLCVCLALVILIVW